GERRTKKDQKLLAGKAKSTGNISAALRSDGGVDGGEAKPLVSLLLPFFTCLV
ncbi:hypothetical protein Dimus_015536, partial [Dionaea muscipula]